MLNPQVMQVVSGSSPAKRLSLILTVRPKGMTKLAEISDRRERAIKLLKMYRTKKAPVLKSFGDYEKAGLRVVDPLVGSPSFIVSAPARVWRQLIRDHPRVFSDPGLDVQTNELELQISA